MAFLRWLASLFSKPTPTVFTKNLGRLALMVARREVGNGERGQNNDGPDVLRYRRGKDTRGAWCASFVSYCLEEGAAEAGVDCPVKRSAGAKRLFKNALAAGGIRVDEPAAGDLVLWQRGAKNSWKGHIGIVSYSSGSGTFIAIEGNRGRFPAHVDTFKHQIGEANLLGFVRFSDSV